MPARAKSVGDPTPAPAAVPSTVNEYKGLLSARWCHRLPFEGERLAAELLVLVSEFVVTARISHPTAAAQ
jgi:hypothetical protein